MSIEKLIEENTAAMAALTAAVTALTDALAVAKVVDTTPAAETKPEKPAKASKSAKAEPAPQPVADDPLATEDPAPVPEPTIHDVQKALASINVGSVDQNREKVIGILAALGATSLKTLDKEKYAEAIAMAQA